MKQLVATSAVCVVLCWGAFMHLGQPGSSSLGELQPADVANVLEVLGIDVWKYHLKARPGRDVVVELVHRAGGKNVRVLARVAVSNVHEPLVVLVSIQPAGATYSASDDLVLYVSVQEKGGKAFWRGSVKNPLKGGTTIKRSDPSIGEQGVVLLAGSTGGESAVDVKLEANVIVLRVTGSK